MPGVLTRVCEVRIADADGVTTVGSGYLVGPRTILTSGHLVGDRADAVAIRFLGDGEWWPAEIRWRSLGQSDEVDAAILYLAQQNPQSLAATAEPIRFGFSITHVGEITVDAYSVQFAVQRSDVDILSGELSRASTDDRRPCVRVARSRSLPEEASPRNAVPGSAVYAADSTLFLGLVSGDRDDSQQGCFTFETTRRMWLAPGFSATLRGLIGDLWEHAEELGEPQRQSSKAQSPARLLRAESRVVEFEFRLQELAQLEAWCAGGGAQVLLVHGQGGQGKTRLALHWLDQIRERGWIGHVIRADLGTMKPTTASRIERVLTHADVPFILVVDYAEAGQSNPLAPAQSLLTRFLDAMARRDRTHMGPVRMLLLARSPGTWWQDLTSPDVTDVPATAIRLEPLTRATDGRAEFYRNALSAMASRLGELEDYRTTDWRRIAADLPIPLGVDQPRFAHALTLLEHALARLLEGGSPFIVDGRTATPHSVLLEHEARYWSRAMHAHGLELTPQTQQSAVAAATLFGAADESEGLRLVAALPEAADLHIDERRRVVNWLRSLYPDEYWWLGVLEPDRLGEYLVSRVWGVKSCDDTPGGRANGGRALLELVEPHLLDRDRRFRLSNDQIRRMFIVLDRVAADDADLDRMRRIARSLWQADGTRELRPAQDESAYRIMDLKKMRASREYIDAQPVAEHAAWQARWAWWNVQRPARIVSAALVVHLWAGKLQDTYSVVAVSNTHGMSFDLATGRQRTDLFYITHEGAWIATACVASLQGGPRAVLGMRDGNIEPVMLGGDRQPWPSYQPLQADVHHPPVACVALADVDGRTLTVSSSLTGPPEVRDGDTGAWIADLDGEDEGFSAMTVTNLPDGPVLVAVGADSRRIRVYDLMRLARICTIEHRSGIPVSIDAYTPDLRPEGLRLVVGCTDGAIAILDGHTGQELAVLHHHSKVVSAVRVESLNGRRVVVSVSHDRRVIVCDLMRGELVGTAFTGHEEAIRALAVARIDDELLAVTADETAVRIWNLAAIGMPEEPLIGHTESMTAVIALTNESTCIAVTANNDNSVRVWDMTRGGRAGAAPLAEMYPTRDTPRALAGCGYRDGFALLVGDDDGRITLLAPTSEGDAAAMWLDDGVVAMACRVITDRLIVAAIDSTGHVRGWNARTGEPLGPPTQIAESGSPYRLVLIHADGHPRAVVATSTTCTTIDLVEGCVAPNAFGGEFVSTRLLGLGLIGDNPCVVTGEPLSDIAQREDTAHTVDLDTRQTIGAAHRFDGVLDHVQIVHLGHAPHALAVGVGGEVWMRDLEQAVADDMGCASLASHGAGRTALTALQYNGASAILIGGTDGGLELVDSATGIPAIDTFPASPTAATLAHYRGRHVLAVASGIGRLVLRDFETGIVAAPPVGVVGKLNALHTVHLRGQQIIVGTSSVGVQAWYADSMSPIEMLMQHNESSKYPAVLAINDRLIAAMVYQDELRTFDVLTKQLCGPVIHNLPSGVVAGARIRLAAVTISDRPVIFAAGHGGDVVDAWDLSTGEPIDIGVETLHIEHLVVGTHHRRGVMYTVSVEGRIDEWTIDEAVSTASGTGFALRPARFVDAGEGITAVAVHPMLGLIAARDSLLELQPFERTDPRPVDLGAPIIDVVTTETTLTAVCQQGVVVIDLTISTENTPVDLRRRNR